MVIIFFIVYYMTIISLLYLNKNEDSAGMITVLLTLIMSKQSCIFIAQYYQCDPLDIDIINV